MLPASAYLQGAVTHHGAQGKKNSQWGAGIIVSIPSKTGTTQISSVCDSTRLDSTPLHSTQLNSRTPRILPISHSDVSRMDPHYSLVTAYGGGSSSKANMIFPAPAVTALQRPSYSVATLSAGLGGYSSMSTNPATSSYHPHSISTSAMAMAPSGFMVVGQGAGSSISNMADPSVKLMPLNTNSTTSSTSSTPISIDTLELRRGSLPPELMMRRGSVSSTCSSASTIAEDELEGHASYSFQGRRSSESSSPSKFLYGGTTYGREDGSAMMPAGGARSKAEAVACQVCGTFSPSPLGLSVISEGKRYKNQVCLQKHAWEHHQYWNYTKKLMLNKHQSVQIMEAAQVLINMVTASCSMDLSGILNPSMSIPSMQSGEDMVEDMSTNSSEYVATGSPVSPPSSTFGDS